MCNFVYFLNTHLNGFGKRNENNFSSRWCWRAFFSRFATETELNERKARTAQTEIRHARCVSSPAKLVTRSLSSQLSFVCLFIASLIKPIITNSSTISLYLSLPIKNYHHTDLSASIYFMFWYCCWNCNNVTIIFSNKRFVDFLSVVLPRVVKMV